MRLDTYNTSFKYLYVDKNHVSTATFFMLDLIQSSILYREAHQARLSLSLSLLPVFTPHLQNRLWSGKPEAPTICPTMWTSAIY